MIVRKRNFYLLSYSLTYLLTAHSAHSAYEKATGGRQRSPVSPCLSSRWVSDVSRKGKGQKGKTEEIFQLHQEGEQLWVCDCVTGCDCRRTCEWVCVCAWHTAHQLDTSCLPFTRKFLQTTLKAPRRAWHISWKWSEVLAITASRSSAIKFAALCALDCRCSLDAASCSLKAHSAWGSAWVFLRWLSLPLSKS